MQALVLIDIIIVVAIVISIVVIMMVGFRGGFQLLPLSEDLFSGQFDEERKELEPNFTTVSFHQYFSDRKSENIELNRSVF